LFNAIVACLAIISRSFSLCATMNAWDAWLYWLDMYVWLLQGEQSRDPMFLPKRTCLA